MSVEIKPVDSNKNPNTTIAGDRSVVASSSTVEGSILTGDNARHIGAGVYIEQYISSASSVISSILHNYANALRINYQLYWQRYVIPDNYEDDTLNIPKPVGQIFECPKLAQMLANSRSVIQSSSVANLAQAEPIDDVEQLHNNRKEDDDLLHFQSTKVLPISLSEFTTLQDIVAVLKARGSFTKGAFLIGEPGAGKTLSMRYFVVQQAQRAIDSDEPIPVYLPLNAYRGETSLFDFIAHVLSNESSDPVFQQFANQLKEIVRVRPLLLLLDGFNEIGDTTRGADEQRKQFEHILADYLGRNSRVSFILSSREFAIPTLPTIKHDVVIYLRPLDQFGISDYLRLYAPEHCNAILEDINASPTLQQLAANPFRAKALAYIYDPNRQLPSTPGTLFEQLVKQLIAREATKHQSPKGRWPTSLSWEISIAKIAYTLQSTHKTAIDTKEIIGSEIESSDLEIAEMCGLLQSTTHIIQFVHQQLQEYFAARWLLDNSHQTTSTLNLSDEILQDSYWDQTLLMLVNLMPASALDELIVQIASKDPFLAAKCVGQSPNKVNPQVRAWLTIYLARGLRVQTLGESETFEKVLRALAEMNCAESFDRLTTKETMEQVCRRSESTVIAYSEAIAIFDHEDAAQFLVKQLYPAIVDKIERYDANPIVLALARMKTPYAQSFLASALQNRKLYIDVLKAIGDHRIQGMDKQIREILESGNHFDEALPAISKANLTALIPYLLPYAHDNFAIGSTLIELGAGQAIIDDYARYQASLNRFDHNYKDFVKLGLVDDHRYNFIGAIRTYLAVEHFLGQTSVHRFIDLILQIVQSNEEYRSLHFALSILVYLRHPALGSALKRVEQFLKLQPTEQTRSNTYPEVSPDSLLKFVSAARNYIELPSPPGFTQQRLENFCFVLHTNRNQLPNEQIPQTLPKLISFAYVEQRQIGQWALLLLQSVNPNADSYGRSNTEAYIVCLELLLELKSLSIGKFIISGITQLLQKMNSEKYIDNFRPEVWKLVHIAVEYGGQNSKQHKEILDIITSWLFVPNCLQQQVAVEICARLDAHEYSASWLLYLNNRTWITAYCIVDLLGRITVPQEVLQDLLKRLQSPLEDRCFFAALALGEIKNVDCIDALIELYSRSNQHVQWAIIWAFGNIGKLTPNILKLLNKAHRSTNSRVRIEVANSAARLRAHELVGTLLSLLHDPDLRVIERAAYALGCLKERAASDQLLSLIDRISRDRHHQSRFPAHYRLIERLEETVAVALVQIGVQPGELEKHFENINLNLKAVCLSEAKRRTTKNQPGQAAPPPFPILISTTEMLARLHQLESLPAHELVRQVTKADLPEERHRALEILYDTNFKDDEEERRLFYEDVQYRIVSDPSPKVRHAIHTHKFHKQSTRTLQFSTYTLHEDLELGMQIAPVHPDLQLRAIRMDERDVFPLYFSQLFGDDYDRSVLQSILCSAFATTYISRNHFTYLATRLPVEKVHLLLDSWRPNKLSNYNHFLDHYSLSLMPLARRKSWTIVPDLIEALLQGAKGTIAEATFCLCELGVHQSYELINQAITRTKLGDSANNSDKEGTNYIELLRMTAMVELAGIDTNLLSADFASHMSDYDASMLWGLAANLLCESEGPNVPSIWGDVQRRLLDFNDYFNTRLMTLKRGFLRWGILALTQILDDGEQGTMRHLQGLPTLVHSNNISWFHNEFEEAVYQIIHDRAKFPDLLVVKWLDEPFWASRLLSMYILIGRKFPFTHEQIIKLLNDSSEHVVLGILSCATEGPVIGLHEMFLQMTEFSQKENNHPQETERAIISILINKLESLDQRYYKPIFSLLKDYPFSALDDTLVRLSYHCSLYQLSDILDVMFQRLRLDRENEILRNRLRELLHDTHEDIICTSISILLHVGDHEIGPILGQHLQKPYRLSQPKGSRQSDWLEDLMPDINEETDTVDSATSVDNHIGEELIIGCLNGITLLQHQGADDDIIRLLDHPSVAVQKAACGACVFLSLEKALDVLVSKIERLEQALHATHKSDQSRSDLEQQIETIAIFVSSHTLIKQEGVLKFNRGTISIPLGSGVVGLLGSLMPFLPNSREFAVPAFSGHVLSLEFLHQIEPSDWRALALYQPHFLRQLIVRDLQGNWLNRQDQQIVIASFELMLAHLYESTNAEDHYTNIITQAEAFQNLAAVCRNTSDPAQMVEKIASMIKANANGLIAQMETVLVISGYYNESSQVLRSRLDTLNQYTAESMTWNYLQEFCEIHAVEQYKLIKGLKRDPLEKDSVEVIHSLSLFSVNELKLLNTEIDGAPDEEFWSRFNHFGRLLNIHNLLYEWGQAIIVVLQEISKQPALGSSYLPEWRSYQSQLIRRMNDKQVLTVDSSTKSNPLRDAFIPFER